MICHLTNPNSFGIMSAVICASKGKGYSLNVSYHAWIGFTCSSTTVELCKRLFKSWATESNIDKKVRASWSKTNDGDAK